MLLCHWLYKTLQSGKASPIINTYKKARKVYETLRATSLEYCYKVSAD